MTAINQLTNGYIGTLLIFGVFLLGFSNSAASQEAGSNASTTTANKSRETGNYEVLTTPSSVAAPTAVPPVAAPPVPIAGPAGSLEIIPAEQAAVEQAVGKSNLSRDYARFSAHRRLDGPTYAEVWYAKFERKQHRGKMLAGVGVPILAIATTMAIMGFYMHAVKDNDADWIEEDWGERFGATFFGILGTAGTVAMLTVGAVSLSTSHEQMRRLYPLLPSNSQYRTKPQAGFRIGPSFASLSVRF